MIIRPYDEVLDRTNLLELLTKRDLTQDNLNDMPYIVTVLYVSRELVAFGGIRRIEPNLGFMEAYITNPDIEPHVRDYALDSLTENLIERCKDHGIKHILSLTTEPNIITRAQDHGFVVAPQQTLLVKKVE